MTNTYALAQGDCLRVLEQLGVCWADSVVCDPPYGLGKEPDAAEMLRHWLAGDDYTHGGGGFMGKTWDSLVPGPATWRAVLRAMKPGAHALVFSGTRTYDLTVMAMRLAGFQIRDQLAWMYGSGFPKSKNVAMSIDKGEGIIGHRSQAAVTAGVDDNSGGRGPDRQVGAYDPTDTPGTPWRGWGTGLKPAHEPIVLARKPLEGTVARNVTTHGTGALNIDGCRIPTTQDERDWMERTARPNCETTGWGEHQGSGMRRPPGFVAPKNGRWPANVLLDPEAGAVLDAQTGEVPGQQGRALTDGREQTRTVYNGGRESRSNDPTPRGDSGGPSRFFYCPKVGKKEREAGLDHLPIRTGGNLTDRKDGSDGLKSPRAGAGRGGGRRNNHPTVKPIALMRYLVCLVTPPGGLVLDPFMGSGPTGIAATLEGFRFYGIELEADYLEIARARIRHWCG